MGIGYSMAYVHWGQEVCIPVNATTAVIKFILGELFIMAVSLKMSGTSNGPLADLNCY